MVGQDYPCHPHQRTQPWQTQILNSWTISGHAILCTQKYNKLCKKRMHVLIQEMKVHMQSRTGARNLLSTIRHTCYRRSGSTDHLDQCFLRCSFSWGMEGSSCRHSWQRRGSFRSSGIPSRMVTLPASCTISTTAAREKCSESSYSGKPRYKKKKENLIPNMPSILKSSKPEGYTHCWENMLGQILNLSNRFCLFDFLAAPHSLWDLSSPTRDWTWALSSESMEF